MLSSPCARFRRGRTTAGLFEDPDQQPQKKGNPWGGARRKPPDWAKGAKLPAFSADQEYCLFTCCTTAYDPGSKKAGGPSFNCSRCGVSFGSLGTQESCCGDHAGKVGGQRDSPIWPGRTPSCFVQAGVKKILTTSPHCLNAFTKDYAGLKDVTSEHYTEVLDELIIDGPAQPGNEVGRHRHLPRPLLPGPAQRNLRRTPPRASSAYRG